MQVGRCEWSKEQPHRRNDMLGNHSKPPSKICNFYMSFSTFTHFHPLLSTFSQLHLFSSTFILLHPLPRLSSFIHFYPPSSTFTNFDPPPSTFTLVHPTFIPFTLLYPLPSVFTNFHSGSSHLHPPSATLIHFLPLPSTFTLLYPLPPTFIHLHPPPSHLHPPSRRTQRGPEGVWALYANQFHQDRPFALLSYWRGGRLTTAARMLRQEKLADLRGAVLKVCVGCGIRAVNYGLGGYRLWGVMWSVGYGLRIVDGGLRVVGVFHCEHCVCVFLGPELWARVVCCGLVGFFWWVMRAVGHGLWVVNCRLRVVNNGLWDCGLGRLWVVHFQFNRMAFISPAETAIFFRVRARIVCLITLEADDNNYCNINW